ncbi:MAG: AAA family ATPase [Actinomycetota bacterium]
MTGLRRASKIPLQPVERTWHDLLVVGMLNVVAGRSGYGKSLVTTRIGADRSQLGETVLLSDAEDSDRKTVKARLMAAGADLERVHIYGTGDNPMFPEDTDAVVADMERRDASILIVDPIAAHTTLSLYGAAGARRALEGLTAAADDRNFTIIGVHHVVKNIAKSSDPIAAVGGASGGLSAVARVIHLLGPNPHQYGERVLVPLKFNVGEWPDGLAFTIGDSEWVEDGGELITAGTLTIVRDDVSIDPKRVLEASGLTREDVSELARAAEWLTKHLSSGPKAANEVKADAEANEDIHFATLKRATKDVGVVKRREGFGRGSYVVWDLPPGHPGRHS